MISANVLIPGTLSSSLTFIVSYLATRKPGWHFIAFTNHRFHPELLKPFRGWGFPFTKKVIFLAIPSHLPYTGVPLRPEFEEL